ncbi:MAG: hypothetical protein GQE15_31510 [Archangiaceae bacterium]|nr:hypothetical protein [Archangiaceae bacterium]
MPLSAVSDHVGKLTIVQVLGDAEAFVFDFAKLSPQRQTELVTHHLAAFDARKQGEGKAGWVSEFVPFALLGHSMPPAILGRVDLSAPHEGVLLCHLKTGALLYAPSKADEKLVLMGTGPDMLEPRESFLSDVFDPNAQSYAYEVDRSECEGFTVGEIETLMTMAGGELTLI